MKNKLGSKFWIALVIFSLTGQIAWVVENMYFNVFIYKMFSASASDISLMVAASAVCATLTTVFMGALSDKIGKRKLFISGGSDHDGLCGGYYSSFENPKESEFYVPECSCGTQEFFFREIKTRTLAPERGELIDKLIKTELEEQKL